MVPRRARSASWPLLAALGRVCLACGGAEQVRIELPDDVAYVAVLTVKDARAPVNVSNLTETTGIVSVDEFLLVPDQDVVLIGWTAESIEPLLPESLDVVREARIRLREDKELIEDLPNPSWQQGVATTDGSLHEASIPDLTADWLPILPAWTQLPSNPAPPPRYTCDLVVDAKRDRLLLFGGLLEPRIKQADDTWIFDGQWYEVQTATRPPPRSHGALEPDPLSDGIILFGGHGGSLGRLNDTWRFNGSTWEQLEPDASPEIRSGHRMSFDPIEGRIVLFGGESRTGEAFADTWIFDGQTWTRLETSVAPPGRFEHSMFFHEDRGSVLVMGGRNATEALDDVWELRGDEWHEVPEMRLPAIRSGFAATYVPTRGWVVIHGGSDEVQVLYEGTLIFDGAWRALEERTSSPVPRNLHASAYWASRNVWILFGGVFFGAFEDRTVNETHELDFSP